jgi:hypothetical protein
LSSPCVSPSLQRILLFFFKKVYIDPGKYSINIMPACMAMRQ